MMADSNDGPVPPVIVHCYSPWARWGLGAATALLLLVSVTVTWGFAASGWNAPMAVIALFLAGLTIFAVSHTAASIWNVVCVEVIAGDVMITTGPVPWTARRIIIGGTIEQLYVQQAPLGKPFWPSIGGPFDVKARLRDGMWITIVSGCCTEKEARQVERRVEAVLQRRDEYGEVDDDERSEVFAAWRESLGPRPVWLDVRRQGDLVNIRYRDAIAWQLLHVLIGAAVATIGVTIIVRLQMTGLDAALCGMAALWGVAHAIGAMVRQRTIIVNATHIARAANWPLWKLRQVAVERTLVKSLDCRSRTITRRISNRGSSSPRYSSIRYRRYWVVAYNPQQGHFRLTEDLRTRAAALHLMHEIGAALGVIAAATPWADDAEDGGGDTPESRMTDPVAH